MAKRMYGLFEKQAGKWVRLYPDMAYPKEAAVRLFQNALLEPFFKGGAERCLRPLPKG